MSTQDNGKGNDTNPPESLNSGERSDTAEVQLNSKDIPSIDAPLEALKLDANESHDTRLQSVELHRPEENAREHRPQPIQTEIAAEASIPPDANMADYVSPPTPGASPLSDPAYRKALEEDAIRTNTIPTLHVDLKNVKANTLSPKEQEKQDESMLEGIQALLNNKFSTAQSIFKSHAREDPLHMLGLGSMAFLKAVASLNPMDADVAIDILSETYQFADAQVEATSAKTPIKDAVSHLFTNLIGNSNTSSATSSPADTRPAQGEAKNPAQFMPNGALRAHVIKAECGLLLAIVHLSQETMLSYLKMGLNLRRAYTSYSLVWEEYKRMGQDCNKLIDPDTISAIQFGIGSVHLLRASLPPKILKVISAFGWNADKNLGFALLKLCLEGKRIRAPLASMMLLTYYVILTSHAPLVLNEKLMQPAIECLLDAQKTYSNSAFFLYFAGRVSRLTRNLTLSTQSFEYTYQVSQGDWAEFATGQLATYEIAFNAAMGFDWTTCAQHLHKILPSHAKPAFIKYFYGACLQMMGQTSDAILAYADAAKLVPEQGPSAVEQFVRQRVAYFEKSGYQDLDLFSPALEILLLWNNIANMPDSILERALAQVEDTLGEIYEREKKEYEIRTMEIAPDVGPPDYYHERATLLLIKISVLNALGRGREAITHINWILDNQSRITTCKWTTPFTYWEAGVTCWCMEDYSRARRLWERAFTFSSYVFEYRLAVRLNLAITHANELGILSDQAPKPEKGRSTQGRKRMSIFGKSSPPDTPKESSPQSPSSPTVS